MGLIKNDIPILEYDTSDKAMIMSGHSTDFHFPERAVMLFMEKEIDDYVVTNECEIIGQFITVTKLFSVYKTVHNGVELAICQAPLGGAAATQIMEQLIAGGVKKVVAAGCCGALVADKEGIQTSVSVNIPDSLSVDDMELAITISNLLENAVYACLKLPEKDRYLKMTAKYKNQLLLEIENSCEGMVLLDEDGHPFSDEKNHGIGTRSVLAFINKTNSEIYYIAEEKRFRVRMIL